MDIDKKLERWLYGEDHGGDRAIPVELCVDIKNAVAEIRRLRYLAGTVSEGQDLAQIKHSICGTAGALPRLGSIPKTSA